MRARIELALAFVLVSAAFGNACSYDFQDFVANEAGAAGSARGGRNAETKGGEAGSDAGSAGELSSGGTTSTGGTANRGGAASSGGSAAATCSGAAVSGVCWYLGAFNQSCSTVCSTHGGVDPAAEAVVGVPSQGGSLKSCASVLAALGVRQMPSEATRLDMNGVGCHLYDSRNPTPYWLSSPRFTASARTAAASIACGCLR